MSSALAIASVTAVLKNLLGNTLVQQSTDTSMGDVTITALPPDRISTGAEERTQLNVHLYRLTPNASWRHPGVSQKGPQDTLPLALDLHYLVTAYGERDFQAEVLLGYAVQCLYETPVLTREVIRSALMSPSSRNGSSAELRVLSVSSLADQLEQITIRPEFLSMEEMSKVWTSLQTRARISVTYQLSAILIEHRSANTTVLAEVS
ncbi:MAG TPA: DUF4255 domain-containing protein [Ktedonobacteraceae bacterium]|nr:DUF4255 domain-containing protein [Ktedonobacteraceae bacterium]